MLTETELKDLLRRPFCLGLIMEEHDFDWEGIFTEAGCNFQQYGLTTIPGGWSEGYVSIRRDYTNHGHTFRLRPDYEEKTEFIECEVYESCGLLYYDTADNGRELTSAINNNRFAGFRFEGGYIGATPWIMNDDDTAEHAIHVLLRRE